MASSADENFPDSDSSGVGSSQLDQVRRHANHQVHPYHARSRTRRSLRDQLSPESIQLAQNSPSPASSDPRSSPARTPPPGTPLPRRSPRLDQLGSAGTDTATSSTSTQRMTSERRSPRLAQRNSCSSGGTSASGGANLYRLVVSPIIKQTVSQRNTSGQKLGVFAVEGSTFSVMIKTLWDKYREYMKGRAVEVDGEWSICDPDPSDWVHMMQFKGPRHLVDSNKTENAWNSWMTSDTVKRNGVKLLIYEYGSNITTQPVQTAFKRACIDPQSTDRAGAVSEAILQEVAGRLQQKWASTFQGAAIVWRMWANHIVRDLNRSNWDARIDQPPPAQYARFLSPSESRLEQQISGMSRSANLALDCVNAAIVANDQLIHDWDAFGAKLKENSRCLQARKAVIDGFINNVLPPQDVDDPIERIENIPDLDHE